MSKGMKRFAVSPAESEKEMVAALGRFATAPETLKTDQAKVSAITTLLLSPALAGEYAPDDVHALCVFVAHKILDDSIKGETLEAISADPPNLSELSAIKARASSEQLVFDEDHPELSDMYRLLSALWKNDRGIGQTMVQAATAMKQLQTDLKLGMQEVAILHALEADSSRATEETRRKTLEMEAALKDMKKENVAMKEALERKANSLEAALRGVSETSDTINGRTLGLETALRDVSSKSDTINRRTVSLEAALRDVSQRSDITSGEEADTADSAESRSAMSRDKRAEKRLGVGRVAPDLQKKFEEEALKMYTFKNGVWLPKPVPGDELDRLAKLVIEL